MKSMQLDHQSTVCEQLRSTHWLPRKLANIDGRCLLAESYRGQTTGLCLDDLRTAFGWRGWHTAEGSLSTLIRRSNVSGSYAFPPSAPIFKRYLLSPALSFALLSRPATDPRPVPMLHNHYPSYAAIS